MPTDTSSRQASLVADFVIFFTLAVIAVLARFYSRVKLLQGLKAEDWLILIALVCLLPTVVLFEVRRLTDLGTDSLAWDYHWNHSP